MCNCVLSRKEQENSFKKMCLFEFLYIRNYSRSRRLKRKFEKFFKFQQIQKQKHFHFSIKTFFISSWGLFSEICPYLIPHPGDYRRIPKSCQPSDRLESERTSRTWKFNPINLSFLKFSFRKIFLPIKAITSSLKCMSAASPGEMVPEQIG